MDSGRVVEFLHRPPLHPPSPSGWASGRAGQEITAQQKRTGSNMKILLLLSHDAGTGNYWKEYSWDHPREIWGEGQLLDDIAAHLNTSGVSRIEIIMEDQ
jgi:hypothetical protein